jgi:signal transduction histidine kinase
VVFLKRAFAQPREWAGNGRIHTGWRYVFPFLLSLLTLGLLCAAARAMTWPSDGLTWLLAEGQILSVAPGGPGERAGLRPGDVVLAIDGRPLVQTPLYAGWLPGQPVVLTIQRGFETREIPLILEPPSTADLLWRLVPVAVGLSFWGSGVVLFVLRPRPKVCRAFFLLCQSVAAALSSGQLSAVNLVWAAHFFYLTLLTLPPVVAYLYAAVVAPDERVFRAAPWGMAIVSSLLALPEGITLAAGVREWRVVYGPLSWPVWRDAVRLYLGLALLAVIVMLIYAYFATRSTGLRLRLRGLAFGMALGFIPLLFLSLLPELLAGAGAGLPYQVTFLFLVLVPLSHAYVIVKHDLAPLDRFLNRSLVVFTLGLIWSGLYLAGIGVGMAFFREVPLLYPVVGTLVTMGMATVFASLRERVQRLVDYLFYGGWYDFRSVIAQVSQALNGATTRGELADRLVAPVADGLRLKGAALYLRTASGGLTLEGCQGLELPKRLEAGDLTTRSDICLDVTAQAAEAGVGSSVAYRLPLVQDGRLLGLLLLGEKRGSDFFEPSDTQILGTLREQATLAAGNVLLMDELQQAMLALAAAQRRMLTAREEERRLLAWDLHDGPVQDLLALGYRLHECRDRAWLHEGALSETLEEMRQEAARIAMILREACSALRSDVLDAMGVGPAMIQYACNLMEQTGVTVYLDVPRQGTRLADPLGITLLRIFQEALNNAVQHAGASEVWTSFVIEGGTYELRVWDEGHGFVVPERLETLALTGHFGLATMKERMASVEGDLEVHSGPGLGTRIHAWGKVVDGGMASGIFQQQEGAR